MLTLLIANKNEQTNLVEQIASLNIFAQIWSACLGEDAIAIAQVNHPSLILCDLSLPDLSGEDMLARLKETPKTEFIPFIFLTSNPGERSACMALGAEDFIATEEAWNSEDLAKRFLNVIVRHQLLEERGRKSVLSTLPIDALIEESISSASAAAQLILLDPSASTNTKRRARHILLQIAKMVRIFQIWRCSTYN